MIDNPLAGLVPHIAPRERPVQPSWAVVSGLNPLRVTLPGADGPADFSPLSLAPLESLSVGQKVRLEWMGRTALLTHRTYGTAQDEADAAQRAQAAQLEKWQPLTLSAGWTQYGTTASWGSPSYRIVSGRVELSGMVTGTLGRATPVATMPPVARPSVDRILTGVENYTPISVQVSVTGVLYGNPVRDTPWLSLSSLTYPL